MTKILYKLFIKNFEDTENPKVREQYGKLAGIVGIVTNLFICILKITLGLFQNSIAVIADGINNLSDATSSIVTLLGFKLAAIPGDENHPYGHARMEYLAGMIVSMIICFVGFQLLLISFDKILHPQPIDFNYLTVIILIISVLIKAWQMFFNRKTSKAIHSVALRATAADSRNDVITTISILISLSVGYFTGLQLDGIIGFLVALFIIYSGIMLLRETSSPLLGECPDEELVVAIKEEIFKYPGVLGIHDLVIHNYGPGKSLASVHVEVDAKIDIMESHDMIDNIEKTLSNVLNIHIVAHMDPVIKNDPLTKDLSQHIQGIIENLEGVASMHDLRIVPGPTHTNIIFDAVLRPSCTLQEDEICAIIEQEVQKINPSYFVVITFDKNYNFL